MSNIPITLENPFSGVYLINEGVFVRSTLVVGNGAALLMDCGGTGADVREAVSKATDLSPMLMLTHGDSDHMACLSHFDSAYAHRDDFDRIRDKCGFGVELKPISGGDLFDLGDRELEVVHVPGHTPGSVALLDRRNRLLFAGDVVSRRPIFMFGPGRDMPLMLKSLERLEALSGAFDYVIPSHGKCPLPPASIGEVRELCELVLAGRLEGKTPPDMGGPKIDGLWYTYNNCGVFY